MLTLWRPGTPQWEQWVALDTLLEKPQFYSLEMVNIKIMKSPELMASGFGELLAGKLLFLPVKRTRKLKVTFTLN